MLHRSPESAFRDIYFVSDKLDPVPPGEVAAFEGWLRERFGLPLSPGYREYMTSLGAGIYCDLVHVLPPAAVVTDFEPIGKLWGTHFFWEAGRGVLSEEQVERTFAVARTMDGNEIVCCPDRPGELFVLPRHDNHIYGMPVGLLDPLAWNGVPSQARREPPPFRYFEPDRDQARINFFTALGTLEVNDLRSRLRGRWGHAEIREIGGADYAVLFPQAIGGRVQLTKQGEGDGRVGILIHYDLDHQSEIDAVERMLVTEGMYVTWRRPASGPSAQ